jgi:hypothetical protein
MHHTESSSSSNSGVMHQGKQGGADISEAAAAAVVSSMAASKHAQLQASSTLGMCQPPQLLPPCSACAHVAYCLYIQLSGYPYIHVYCSCCLAVACVLAAFLAHCSLCSHLVRRSSLMHVPAAAVQQVHAPRLTPAVKAVTHLRVCDSMRGKAAAGSATGSTSVGSCEEPQHWGQREYMALLLDVTHHLCQPATRLHRRHHQAAAADRTLRAMSARACCSCRSSLCI